MKLQTSHFDIRPLQSVRMHYQWRRMSALDAALRVVAGSASISEMNIPTHKFIVLPGRRGRHDKCRHRDRNVVLVMPNV